MFDDDSAKNSIASAYVVHDNHVTDTHKFVSTFTFSLTISLIVLTLYFGLKCCTKLKSLFQPKIVKKGKKRSSIEHAIRLTKTEQDLCNDQINKLSHQDLMKHIGLDGVVFLLFISACIKICIFCTLFAVIILLPTYVTEEKDLARIHSIEYDFIGMISIGHLNARSWRLWMSVFSAYSFVLCALKILYDTGVIAAKMSDIYMSQPHVSHYTVMLSDIPKLYSNQEQFSELLNSLFPRRINEIHMIKDTKQQQYLQMQLKKTKKLLSEAVSYNAKHNERQERIISYFPYPKYGDCVEYYKLKINQLESEIKYLSKCPKYGRSAFIHFNNLVSTSQCVSTQIFCSNHLYLKSALAPYPQDIMQKNMVLSIWDDLMYKIILNFCVLIIVSLWLFLINFSVLVDHISHIFKYISTRFGMVDLNHHLPVDLLSLISGMIPTLLIKGCLALLPLIIEVLYWKLSSIKDAAKIKMEIYNKYYQSLMVMLLIGVAATKTLSSNIFMNLGSSLQTTSTFFLQYMMVTALITDPIHLFYPVTHYFLSLLRQCFIKKKKDKSDNVELREFDFPFFYANLSLELIITISYSVCTPLILGFSLMHFIMSALIHKHLLITYFRSTCSMGRFVYIHLLQNIMYGLCISIMTLIGMVTLKNAYVQAVMLLLLFLLIVVQAGGFISFNTKMSSAFKYVCLETAIKVDAENRKGKTSTSVEYPNNLSFEQCYVEKTSPTASSEE